MVGEHDMLFVRKEDQNIYIYDFRFFSRVHVFIPLMRRKKRKVMQDRIISHTSSILDFDVGNVPAVSMTIPESDVGTLLYHD